MIVIESYIEAVLENDLYISNTVCILINIEPVCILYS